jgi:CHAT domain-containing protein
MLSRLPLAGLVCTIALFTPLTSMPVMAESAMVQTIEQKKAEADRLFKEATQDVPRANVTLFLAPTYIHAGHEALYKNLKPEQSLKSLQRALKIYRDLNDRRNETITLLWLSSFINFAPDMAIEIIEDIPDIQEKALAIAREIGDKDLQILSLMAISGTARLEEAIALAKSSQSKLRLIEATIRLGGLYKFDETKAIEIKKQAFAMAIELANNSPTVIKPLWVDNESSELVSISWTHCITGSSEVDVRVTFCKYSLQLSKALKDVSKEIWFLQNLSRIFSFSNNSVESLNYAQQLLELSSKTRNLDAQMDALDVISKSYYLQLQYPKALEAATQWLALAQQAQKREQSQNIITIDGADYDISLPDFNLEYALIRLSNIYSDMGNVAKSVEYKEKHDRHIQNRAIDNTIEGKRLQRRRKKLDIAKNSGNLPDQAKALEEIASDYYSLDSAKSLAYYEQLVAILPKIPNYEPSLSSFSHLGNLYKELGNYPKAISFYKTVLSLDEKQQTGTGFIERDGALLNIGEIYVKLGDSASALPYLHEYLASHQKRDFLLSQPEVLTKIVEAYAMTQNYTKAIEYQQMSIDIIAKLDNSSYNQYRSFDNLVSLYESAGNTSGMLATYQQKLTVAQSKNDRTAEAKTLSQLGTFFTAQKEPELAIVFYKQYVNLIQTVRQDLKKLPLDQQKAYTETVAEQYRTLADLLLQNDRILEARQVIELLKLQEIDNYNRETRGPISGPANPVSFLKAETELLNAFNKQITGNYTSLFQASQELETLRKTEEKTPAIQKRIRDLEELKTTNRNNLAQFLSDPTISSYIKNLRNNDKTLEPEGKQLNTLRETLASLKQSNQTAAILYPLILDDRLEIILITPNGPPLRRTVKIDRPTLNKTILQFGLETTDPDKDPRANAQQLYQWLIKPIEADLKEAGIETLIYSPDRLLRSIPIAALHDGQQWLAEKYQISHFTSLNATNFLAKRNAPPKVLSGTISDQPSTIYNVKLQDNPESYRFEGLPAGKIELNAINKSISGSKNLIENDFSSDRLRDDASQFNILHLATHGYFDVSRPENSFLLFSQPDSRGKNYATITDISNWELNGIDLVTLSACQTAVTPDKAETKLGVLGISYEFESAGARSTIASLWRVNDRSTALLMQAFYQNLSQGKTKAEALKNAQNTMLHLNTSDTVTQAHDQLNRSLSIKTTIPIPTTPPKNTGYSHPYYWAPFILIGNSL